MTAPEGRMPVVLAAHGFSVLVTAGAVADERPQTTAVVEGGFVGIWLLRKPVDLQKDVKG